MKIRDLPRCFFSERSFPLYLKSIVFSTSLVFYLFIVLAFHGELLSPAEARLTLYLFYMVIFLNSFFCGFIPGIVFSALSSFLAITVIVPQNLVFKKITVLDFEVFSFLTIYFLIAITVDWFRDNIEKLQRKIAENEQLHEQTRHMEKLAMAGEIAAGIAHEIRNPLTVVQGYIQLMGQKSRGCEYEEIYALVLEEIRRANQIISDFLRFSRPARPQRTLIQLNDLIEAASSLLFGEASQRNVHIYTYPDPELPDTCLDKDQLMQVLLNLFSNALQSMPGGGSLSVFTSFDRAANTLAVQISDSGIGIPADILEKIFTPFFTTRENGTGLGLPITQSIVQAHRGQINVESIPGQGTRFILNFPVVQDCAFAPEVG